MSVKRIPGTEPVAEFCAGLRRLRQASGYELAALARELNISRSQMYAILSGNVRRPPDWARFVRPMVNACTGGDTRELAMWRQRHAVLVSVFEELSRHERGTAAESAGIQATKTLPRDIASFTGRQPELTRLAGAAENAWAVVGIHAIGGMAGVGKTAFAVHAAHQLGPQFPDGQLFLPLHGHTPGHQPVDPEEALASLLLTAGISAGRIPPGLEARSRVWRDHLAGQRVLLVLDDAASSEQVEPLLPGASGSLVLVTSRRHLAALDGAEMISLDVLAPDEATRLLVRLASRADLAPGDGAVVDICRLCGYLPLAIGMLARQLHHHRAWTPAGMAADLAAARNRLELLTVENVSVAAAFDLSCRDLAGDQLELFRRLSLHPGRDIDAYAAAALDDTSPPVARHRLAALSDQHLLGEPGDGRYRLHDLLREHARALAAQDPATDSEAATARLLDYYESAAASAEACVTRMTPVRPAAARAPGSPPGSPAVPELSNGTQALTWARTERANLLACLDQVTENGQHARVVALTAAIAALLQMDGPWTDAVARHSAAAESARQLGDRIGEANALTNLGIAWLLARDYRAAEALSAALDIYTEVGNRLGQAHATTHLGDMQRLHGNCREATQRLNTALSLYTELGDRLGQAHAWNNLSMVREASDDYPGAIQASKTAMALYHDLGNLLGQANALENMGCLLQLTGDYPQAIEHLNTALRIFDDIDNRLGKANALKGLGDVRRLTGDFPGAAAAASVALNIYRDLGAWLGQANTTKDLGIIRRLAGDYRVAAEMLESALGIYRRIGAQLGLANALNELGIVRRLTGDYAGAVEASSTALEIYRKLPDKLGQAYALTNLGALHRLGGDYPAAAQAFDTALKFSREVGDMPSQMGVLNEQGTLARLNGSLSRARARHRLALSLARKIASPLDEAHALVGLSYCAQAAGSAADAETNLHQAHEIFQRIGAAEEKASSPEIDAYI